MTSGNTMLRAITVSTRNFLDQTERLLLSLVACGKDFHLTVFCDDAAYFGELPGLGPCTVIEWPPIRNLGVKRAKFTAYAAAIVEGDFLYLDSDIVVLERLDELRGFDRLAGCPDDLSACPAIPDKRHPWPADPGLENRLYINSGVLFIPEAAAGFIRELRDLAADEAAWQRYILPGTLYDNHFLCAQINRQNVPVRLLDETIYNWQGFFKDGQLQVERRGESLINRKSGERLRLVHFAGTREVDGLLGALPVEVASLIAERGSRSVKPPLRAFSEFLAALSPAFSEPLPDPFLPTVFAHTARELLAMARSGFRRASVTRYFEAPETMVDLACAVPDAGIEWNGLACGGAYLDGDEYNYLTRLVREAKIRTALEVGAGQSSLLLHRLGVDALSLEPSPGPWLDGAVAGGCRCRVVPFHAADLRFDPAALRAALAVWGHRRVDLLFVDSPNGTVNRSRILLQLLAHIQPALVLFHDVRRDAPNLFGYQVETGLELVDYFRSIRGLALLGRSRNDNLQRRLAAAPVEPRAESLAVQLETAEVREAVAGSEFTLTLTLKNRAAAVLSSRYAHPFMVSYHWFTSDGRLVVHDGERTRLPFDLYPGHSARFTARVKAPAETGPLRCQLCLVQEGIRWFDDKDSGGAWLDINLTAAPPRTAGAPRGNTGAPAIISDMTADRLFQSIYARCQRFTITSIERMYAMYQAVNHAIEHGIAGDIVECGVWMGGNCMLAAMVLLARGELRRIWLYDTFEGMSAPTTADVRFDGQPASELWCPGTESGSDWWRASLEQVRTNLLSTGYPEQQLVFVRGKVEDTLAREAPEHIAVLRLDTDWYESTRCELDRLFPRLAPGGVLIVDDYGWWSGSRRAVDEYFSRQRIQMLLGRIDSCGARMGINFFSR